MTVGADDLIGPSTKSIDFVDNPLIGNLSERADVVTGPYEELSEQAGLPTREGF